MADCLEPGALAEPGLAGFASVLGGTFTRILTFGGTSVARGRLRPCFGAAVGSGMVMRVSQEGQVMRRPAQSAAARMFCPHLAQSNWKSFMVEIGLVPGWPSQSEVTIMLRSCRG